MTQFWEFEQFAPVTCLTEGKLRFKNSVDKTNQDQKKKKKPRQNKTPYCFVTHYMMRRWCDKRQDI